MNRIKAIITSVTFLLIITMVGFLKPNVVKAAIDYNQYYKEAYANDEDIWVESGKIMLGYNFVDVNTGERYDDRVVIATFDSSGVITYAKPYDDNDWHPLDILLSANIKKTILIPENMTIKIHRPLIFTSDTTFIATGATIIETTPEYGVVKHNFNEKYSPYSSLSNVTFIGGNWKNEKITKVESTMFRFCNAKNLKFQDLTITTNFQGHGLELIGCKAVSVSNCVIKASGAKTKTKTSVEEALQIDLITKTTAPGVYRELTEWYGNKVADSYMTGLGCQNVTVDKCKILGSRGLCCNYSPKENKAMQDSYHKNITVTNCKLTGESAEGLMIFNTEGIVVKGNTIKTNSKRSKESYSDGLHIVNFSTKGDIKKYTIKITNNKVYGNFNALGIASKTKAKFGKTTITNNKLYCKKSAKEAVLIPSKYFTKLIFKKNSCKKWK